MSMGITTLLSMTVFLMLVAENMPPTSDVLPLVGRQNRLVLRGVLTLQLSDESIGEVIGNQLQNNK